MTYVPAPSYPNYASFLANFIGDLPARSNQAQQQQIQLQQEKQQQAQQQALTQSFSQGLPKDANGHIDWPAATQILSKAGDWRDAINLAPQIQQQQRFIQNQNDTQAEIDDAEREPGSLPPASVAASRPSTPVTPASTGQPSDNTPQQAPAGPLPLFAAVGKRYSVSRIISPAPRKSRAATIRMPPIRAAPRANSSSRRRRRSNTASIRGICSLQP